jgi:hypothetical protein
MFNILNLSTNKEIQTIYLMKENINASISDYN